MHHTHCNYRGILNTGPAQLTGNIKAEGWSWVTSPEHGRFTYPLHTHSKMITELPLPQTRAETGKHVGGGWRVGGGWGRGLAPPYCCKSRRKKKRKKKKGRKKGNRSHTGCAPPAELYLHFERWEKRRYMATCSSLYPANLICQPLVNQGW